MFFNLVLRLNNAGDLSFFIIHFDVTHENVLLCKFKKILCYRHLRILEFNSRKKSGTIVRKKRSRLSEKSFCTGTKQ